MQVVRVQVTAGSELTEVIDMGGECEASSERVSPRVEKY